MSVCVPNALTLSLPALTLCYPTTRHDTVSPDIVWHTLHRQARALYRLRNVRRQEQDAKAEAAVEEKLRRERLRALEVGQDIATVCDYL